MTRRLIAQIHLWTALVLSVPLVLLGLTGSILVFEDELRAAVAPAATARPGKAHPPGDIIAAARAAAPPGYVPSSYAAPAAPGRPATVRLVPPGRQTGPSEAVRIDVDPVTLAASPNAPDDLLRQVFFLHSTLLMKSHEGRVVVGWLGLAMLVMAASGLVNWWPRRGIGRRGAWRRAFGIARDARGLRLLRELHGMAGIWGFAVLAIVSFGGVYLAFPETVRSGVAPILPARDLRAAAAAIKVQPVKDVEPLPIDDAIALALAEARGARLAFAFLPAKPDQAYRVALLRSGQERHETPVTVIVDPWTRRVVETLDPRQFTAGETILAAQHAMHSGQGLGPAWKTLVFLAGLLPALFAASGIAMWRLKRRRPAAAANRVIDQGYTARRAGE